jgi:hypothetical protein
MFSKTQDYWRNQPMSLPIRLTRSRARRYYANNLLTGLKLKEQFIPEFAAQAWASRFSALVQSGLAHRESATLPQLAVV